MANRRGVLRQPIVVANTVGLLILVWVLVLASVVPSALARGSSPPIPGPVDPVTRPVRGSGQQVTPVPAPYWTTGAARHCAPGSLIRSVDTHGAPMIAFTFDDGPDPTYTTAVADVFASRGLTATFFIVGQMLSAYPDVARSLVDRGFIIGNHTVSHCYTGAMMAAEVATMNDSIESTLGVRTPFFRSPGLTASASVDAALAASGQCNVWTDVDLRDWTLPRRSSEQLCSAFAATLHPGEIVLLHVGPGHSQTAHAVSCMLDVAQARGYSVAGLDELLVAGVPSTRQSGRRVIVE
jgi:peptidoglycan/xylan/chitin deacetylase (PgdA/CDA1 family)